MKEYSSSRLARIRTFTGLNQMRLLVLLFYLSGLLLLASGRLASGDAGEQLQATMLLVETGSLGAKAPPGGLQSGWVLSSNGNWYEPHDIGSIIVMLPGAWLASVLSKAPAAEQIEQPSIVARVVVSLTYASLGAIGCFLLFLLFALYEKTWTAFLLSLAFLTTTFFWAYTKSAWDVLGASCMVCALLYLCGQVVIGGQPGRNAVLAGGALALACSFRFSLLPFFGIGLTILFYLARRRLTWRNVASCAALFLVLMLPSLIYNQVRMGSPLRPATTAPQYLAGNNALTGSIVSGVSGLLAAPNRGLFLYSPMLLLLFAFPAVAGKIPREPRQVFIVMLGSSVLYLLLIAKLQNWGAFGWGPRYLLPILPVLFFGTALTLRALWERHHRALKALVVISALLSAAPVLVNWHLATTEYPHAMEMTARAPYQQIAVWHGLWLGLHGKPLPAPPEVANDPIHSQSARFPDLWTARLMEHGGRTALVGIIITLALSGITLYC